MNNIITNRKLPDYLEGDALSLKISSYPVFLEYLSGRFEKKYSVLLELCTGIGVGLIYLQGNFDKLIGVEIDPIIADQARSNIKKAGIEVKIEIVESDVIKIEDFISYNPDVVIYDIPYWSDHDADLLKRNPDIVNLIGNVSNSLTRNIVIYSPPHLDNTHYKKIFSQPFELVEIYINDRHDRNVLFFGDLISEVGVKKVTLKN